MTATSGPLWDAAIEIGRKQGLDEALTMLLDEADQLPLGGDWRIVLELHRKLMRIRFPHMEARCTTTPEAQSLDGGEMDLPADPSPSISAFQSQPLTM